MTTQAIAAKDKTITCTPNLRKITTSVNLPSLNEIFSRLQSASILGANSARADAGRFSYWAAEPREIFEFRSSQAGPFDKLQQAFDKYKPNCHCAGRLPKGLFLGGWVGYFSYELGRFIERLPQTTIDDLKMPLIRLCFYDRLIAYDHKDKTCWLIALQMHGDTESADIKLDGLENLLEQSRRITVRPPCPADFETIDFSQIRCNMDKDYYFKAIEKIKRYIYDGDVYQINFSQRFECDYSAAAMELFHWQNHFNPSPCSAYIDAGDFQIVSASPEMFITVNDGLISTKPIKGTRTRLIETVPNARQINEQNFDELARSEKEQAELNMIIDLERNDLVRICQYGTRKVTQPRTIEIFPTVFHAVATVAGKLRNEITFCDILKAVFPGGSITGAPKIRAMEIIDETEPTERAVYTGSIGYIGLDGSVSLNIAIRTIIVKDQTAYAQTGGGIVADSATDAEWEESLVKARALLAGIRAVNSTK